MDIFIVGRQRTGERGHVKPTAIREAKLVTDHIAIGVDLGNNRSIG